MRHIRAAGALLALALSGCSAQGLQNPFSFGVSDSDVDGWHETTSQGTQSELIEDAPHHHRSMVTVSKGDTLFSLLAANSAEYGIYKKLSPEEASPFVKLYPGDKLEISVGRDKQVVRLAKEIEKGSWYVAQRRGDQYVVSKTLAKSKHIEKRVTGKVVDDFFYDSVSNGLPKTTSKAFLAMMKPKLDIAKEAYMGDEYTIVFGQDLIDGQPLGAPVIEVAQYRHAEVTYTAYRHVSLTGVSGYYDKEGKPFYSGWMKTPLAYKRISSPFNPRRRHPITGRISPHEGVDLAAARGTPIMAASDGKIVQRGVNGGYGNYIKIRHDNGMETRYGHMNRFASGYRTGDMVKKGEVIGYVGSTGRSTGPHLHYEIRVAGKPIDPMKFNPAKQVVLQGYEKKNFLAQVSKLNLSLIDQSYALNH